MTSTNDNPPRASLLGISGEIRNQIYEEVFSSPTPNGAEFKGSINLRPLLTCRQIYQEANVIAFTRTTFVTPKWPGRGLKLAVLCLARSPAKIKHVKVLEFSRRIEDAFNGKDRHDIPRVSEIDWHGFQFETVIMPAPELLMNASSGDYRIESRVALRFLAELLIGHKSLSHVILTSHEPLTASYGERIASDLRTVVVHDKLYSISFLAEWLPCWVCEGQNRVLLRKKYGSTLQNASRIPSSIRIEFQTD